MKKHLKYTALMLIILIAAFSVSYISAKTLNTQTVIPAIFILGVLVVSAKTEGYLYGIIASVLSVLCINFVFNPPYFRFNFSIQENILTAGSIFIVSVITGTLAEKVKKNEKDKADIEVVKMRAELLRALSHDLRTPLTGIFGAGSTITENYDILTDEDKLVMIKGITEDSEWLIRMVENLLSVTKADESGVNLLKSSVVLEELVDSSLNNFKKRYPKVVPEVKIPEEFITVSADALLIEQVILNLLENAVKHAKGMTRLMLNVTSDEEKVFFEVADNGCGMDMKRLKGIFAGLPDFSERSSDSLGRNMGIGLSACYAIIKAHGSELKGNNLKQGGMKFTFSLEREDETDE